MGFETMLNHGVTEFGKDFVLIKNDEFGIRKFTSIIVKKGNINIGAKKDMSTLYDIARQIRESYTIKYHDTLSKQSVLVDRSYFICDGTISDNAKKIIAEDWGVSKELYEKNTTFVSGENLVAIVENNWPLFFSSFAPELTEYYEKLLAKLEAEDKGRSINISQAVSSVSEKFLHNSLYEVVPDINGKIKHVLKNPDHIFTTKSKILIIGQSGTGKSHLLREQIKKSVIREADDGSCPRLKLYMRVSDIAEIDPTVDNINRLVKTQVQKIQKELSDGYVQQFIQEKHLDFFLDGFDEVATEDNRINATKVIDIIFSMFPNSQVVVTTRELNVHLKQGLSNRFIRFDMRQMTYKESIDYLQYVIKETNLKGDEILREIKQQGIMFSLPRTPLTLQLITSLFSDNAAKEVPSNTTEVYKMYSEIMLGRWDKQRDVTNVFDYEQKVSLLSDIAYKMQNDMTECISVSEAQDLTMTFLKDMGADPSKADDILKEIVHRSEVVIFDEADQCFRFKHRSFQEFFTAHKIHSEGGDFREIASHIADPWWDGVLIYLCGFRKKGNDIIQYVIDFDVPEGIEESIFRFRRGTNLGFIIRAAYQSSKKKEAVKKTLEDFEICYQSEHLKEKIRNLYGKAVPSYALHIILQIILSSSYYSKLTKTAILECVDEVESVCQLSMLTQVVAEFENKEKIKCIAEKVRVSKDLDMVKACYYVTEQHNKKDEVKLLESKEMRKLKKSAGIILDKDPFSEERGSLQK